LPDGTDGNGSSNYRTLYQALIVGGLFAVIGIVLFLVIYSALNEVDDAPRLFTALCAPPFAIALLTGIYILYVNRKRSQ
jgi:hypothetical protein